MLKNFSTYYKIKIYPQTQVWLLLFMVCAAAYGDVKFDRISLEDGLSQSTVYCITQDTLGFIWIGTQDGLNKYDGYNFTAYKNDPFDSTSLSDNYITAVLLDKSGALWIGTFGGVLNEFDPATQTFRRYPVGKYGIRAIHEDNLDDGKYLWLGTAGSGLVRFEKATGEIQYFSHNPDDSQSLSHNWVWSISQCPQGNLWLGTNGGGLNQFDRQATRFTSYRHDPANPKSLPHDRARVVYWDRSGNLWIGTDGGGIAKMQTGDDGQVSFIPIQAQPEKNDGLSSNFIWTFLEDKDNNFWVGTRDGGMCRMFGRDKNVRFQQYYHDAEDPASLINNIVISLFEDRSGILWIGAFGGISKFNPAKTKFAHIKKSGNPAASLSHNVVMSLYEDKDNIIWAGTFGGLNRIELHAPEEASDGFSGLPSVKSMTHFRSEAENPKTLTENRIWTITEDKTDMLWIGTLRGLNRYDRKTGLFTRYKHNPANNNSLGSDRVWSFLVDKENRLWIGTDGGGLNLLKRKKQQFVRFQHAVNQPTSLPHNTIRAIHQGKNGLIWIGTFGGGLSRMDISPNATSAALEAADVTFTNYQNKTNDRNSLSSNRIFSIHEDQEGILWIGTDGGGLNRFDPTTGQFTHFTENDGLPNNVVYGILEDEKGRLWLSTNRGISRFDPNVSGVAAFRNYDVDDGLQNSEFNQGSYFKGRSQRMYFGGINGFNIFDPLAIQDNPQPPPIVLTDFKLFYESLPVKAEKDNEPEVKAASIASLPEANQKQLPASLLTEKDEIILSYDQNVFSFEFAALDYTNPEKNQYAYMLEGFDKDWIYSGSRRYASYTNLDGGDYVFRVKGSNSDRVWNEKGIAVNIRITPPFWKTWWFQFAGLAFMTALLFSFYRYRVNKLLEVERTRLRISQDLHDEVSATLSSISYFAQAIRNAMPAELPSMPQRFLGLITESASEAQEAMNDIIWSINPQNDDWDKLFAKLRRYTSDLLESRNIRYEMTTPPAFPAKTLGMERRRVFWLLFKEMVTNAAKHSDCKMLLITIETKQNTLSLSVEDDGCGFDANKPTDRNGLKNIRARANTLNADLQLETAENAGTRWQLAFQI